MVLHRKEDASCLCLGFSLRLSKNVFFGSCYLKLDGFKTFACLFVLILWGFWCCKQHSPSPKDQNPQFGRDLEVGSFRGLKCPKCHVFLPSLPITVLFFNAEAMHISFLPRSCDTLICNSVHRQLRARRSAELKVKTPPSPG